MRELTTRLDGVVYLEPAVHSDDRGFFGEGQARLVRCARGRIWDVVVDVRRDSPSYGQWEAFELDDQQLRQLYIPVGYAHGFCVLSDVADVVYKCSTYYDPGVERGFRWNDPDVGIAWPEEVEWQVSARDAEAPLLRELSAALPLVYASIP
jgi:dTDP-4-dehydrorhamnose 3,5-epimerase